MKLQYKDYGFYKIKNYDRKPHLGLLVDIDKYTYCIPLTSAKPRHLGWQNITEHNYIIYEIVGANELHNGDIYKKYTQKENTFKKLLSVLEIRKMIPVNNQVAEKIIFDDIADVNEISSVFFICRKQKNSIQMQKENCRAAHTAVFCLCEMVSTNFKHMSQIKSLNVLLCIKLT